MGKGARHKQQRRIVVKKVLAFEAKSERFSFIWQSVVLSSLQQQEKRTFDRMRREAKIVDALEQISEVDGQKLLPGGDPARIVSTPQTIIMEQADIDILKSFIEAIQWKATATKGAVDAYDWLSSAPEQAN